MQELRPALLLSLKTYGVEGGSPFHDVVGRSPELVGEDGHADGFAVFGFQSLSVRLAPGRVAGKAGGCLGKRPLEMCVADFAHRRRDDLAGRGLLGTNQSSIGGESPDTVEAVYVADLVEDVQREDRSDAGNGLQ